MNIYYSSYDSNFVFGSGMFLIAFIITILITGYPLYNMAKMANLKNPWMAFVPILQSIILFNLANVSGWWMFGIVGISLILFLIPIANVIAFVIIPIGLIIYEGYILYQALKNFQVGVVGFLIGFLISPVFVYWYIVIKKPNFIGKLDSRFLNNIV